MSESNPIPVITVDGPSGVGKGTLCRRLARALGWHMLDSGSLYRLTALAAQRRGVALDDAEAVAALAAALEARFEPAEDDMHVLLEGCDVSLALRTEACGNAASKVAALPAVRAALLERQHAFRAPPGLVADGRDMGTAIFPDAGLKLFLSASATERARRRHKQLSGKGIGANLATLEREIAERDARDAGRKASPLVPAPDAVLIDTDRLDIEAVYRKALDLVRDKRIA